MRKEDVLKNGITILREENKTIYTTVTFDITNGIYRIRLPYDLFWALPIFMSTLSSRFNYVAADMRNGRDFMSLCCREPLTPVTFDGEKYNLSLADFAGIIHDIVNDFGEIKDTWFNANPELCPLQTMFFGKPENPNNEPSPSFIRKIEALKYEQVEARRWHIYFPENLSFNLPKIDILGGYRFAYIVTSDDTPPMTPSELEEIIISAMYAYKWVFISSTLENENTSDGNTTKPSTNFNVFFIDADKKEIEDVTLTLSGLWECYKVINKIEADALSCQVNELCSTDEDAPKHYTDILQADLIVTGEKFSGNWLAEYIAEHQIYRAFADQITKSPNVGWFSDIFDKKINNKSF